MTMLGHALHFRLLVLAVAAGVLTLGGLQLRGTPVDVLPEFTPTYAEVQTEALGLSAEEVEQLITVPLEADLLNGVEGVDVIRSESVPGLSSIVMVFAGGTDIYRARQLVEERLTQAHALPNVSKPPTLLAPLSSSSRVLMIGLSTRELTPIEQSVLARWTVRPRLMGVPGVANVAVWGMRDQQLQVQVDPAQLRDRKVTLSQVVETAGNAQVVSPLSFLEASTPGTGGFVETPQQRLQVRHLLEKIADPAELAKVPVAATGGSLRLGDVADIRVDHQPLIGDAVVAGGPGLLMVVEKFPGASAPEVTEGVEAALETLRPGLTGVEIDTSVLRPASYLDDALGNLKVAALAGALLLLLGLLALRFHWRALLVTVVALPLSLVAAGLLLRLFGQGFNALALAGLAAAVTIVVDEAVAPSDRIVRRLRHARRTDSRQPVSTLVQAAAAEARRPLTYATLVVLLAVLPLAVLGGRPGAFFAPLVLAYALAVVAAMVVALTVTPALTAVLCARWQPARQPASAASRRFGAKYRSSLTRFSRTWRPAVLVAAAMALIGLAVLPFLQTSVLPTFQDRNVLVRLEGQPGASNARMTEITTGISRELGGLPGVAAVGAHIGRAVTGDRVTNVSSSDVWVAIAADADYEAARRAIDATVRDVPDVRTRVTTYSSQEMRDVGALLNGDDTTQGEGLALLTGTGKPLAVRLFGQDPAVLRQEADRVRAALAAVDGVVEPAVDQPPAQPTIEIEVDLEKALAFGVTPGDVRRAEATLLQGIQVGSVFEQQKVFDVVVQGVPGTRDSVDDVRNLLVDRPAGGHVRLGQVADVRIAQTPAVIQRDAVSRRLDVTAEVSGRSAAAVAADVRAVLATMDFPIEYHAEVLAASTSEEVGTGRVVGFAVAAGLAALLLLQAAFRSWRLALLVFAALPLALVGGLVAALVTGVELSLGALLGLLAVFGLAARTSIPLVAGLQSRGRRAEDDRAAALVNRGTSDELSPVLRSSAALALLALPFALLGGRPGLELLHPLAVVLLGGLVTTALVTLFVLPALYVHLGGRATPPTGHGHGAPRQRVEVERRVARSNGWHGERAPAAASLVTKRTATP